MPPQEQDRDVEITLYLSIDLRPVTDSHVAAHFLTHSWKRASKARGNTCGLQNDRFQILRREALKTPCSQTPTGHYSQASTTRSKGLTQLSKSCQTTVQSHPPISELGGGWRALRNCRVLLLENLNFFFIQGAQSVSASPLPPALHGYVCMLWSLEHNPLFRLEWFYECDTPVKSCCKLLATVPLFNSSIFPSTQTRWKLLAALLEQLEANG